MSIRIIEVVDYQLKWAADFDSEKLSLHRVLGSCALSIEHMGSTAVVGLAAKPVIDILIEVSSLAAIDTHQSAMELLGYSAKGENGIAGRRYYQKGGKCRTHHIHAFELGDENLIRHRAFRDYLIAHPEIAAEYGYLKKAAALQCGNDSVLYAALKNSFIQKHEKLAMSARLGLNANVQSRVSTINR